MTGAAFNIITSRPAASSAVVRMFMQSTPMPGTSVRYGPRLHVQPRAVHKLQARPGARPASSLQVALVPSQGRLVQSPGRYVGLWIRQELIEFALNFHATQMLVGKVQHSVPVVL